MVSVDRCYCKAPLLHAPHASLRFVSDETLFSLFQIPLLATPLQYKMSVSLWHGEGHGGPCHEGGLRHDRGPVGPRHLAGYCRGLRMTCLLCW